jgi:hypothetical protein
VRASSGHLDGCEHGASRISVSAVAENHVQQQHGHPRVIAGRHDGLVPQRRIDHRMSPTTGVLVIAKVDDLVLDRVTECDARLIRERAAAEKSTDLPLADSQARPGHIVWGHGIPRSMAACREARRLVQVAGDLDT